MIKDFSSGKTSINNITFSRALQRLAKSQLDEGDWSGAETTLNRLEQSLYHRREVLRQPPFKPHVLKLIQNERQKLLEMA
jgi:hypothetical protein